MTKRKDTSSSNNSTYSVVVVDIEGTTTPISFVHDVLFPHVLSHLAAFLKGRLESDQILVDKIEALRSQAAKDVADGMDGAALILPADHANKSELHASIIANVEWQMKADRKIGPLKDLQGYMWKFAYESGDVLGVVYKDVPEALEKWKEMNIPIYVYSSGSVAAQKLIFGYSDQGDILHYFSGHFDTAIGLKTLSESYTRIAESIRKPANEILFLSDNVKENDAARSVGYQVAIVFREGNAALDPEPTTKSDDAGHGFHQKRPDGSDVPVIKSFAEIFDRSEDFSAATAVTIDNNNGKLEENNGKESSEKPTVPTLKKRKSSKSPAKEPAEVPKGSPARSTRSKSKLSDTK